MPKPLPLKTFLKTFESVPRLAVSLVVKNNKQEILLARRAIPPKKGSWHMPGGFVLKGEPLAHCIVRVCKKEIGLTIDSKSATLMGAFDNLDKDPRGHVVDLIYEIKVITAPAATKENEAVKFFKKLPPSIGFNHGETLRSLGHK